MIQTTLAYKIVLTFTRKLKSLTNFLCYSYKDWKFIYDFDLIKTFSQNVICFNSSKGVLILLRQITFQVFEVIQKKIIAITQLIMEIRFIFNTYFLTFNHFVFLYNDTKVVILLLEFEWFFLAPTRKDK